MRWRVSTQALAERRLPVLDTPQVGSDRSCFGFNGGSQHAIGDGSPCRGAAEHDGVVLGGHTQDGAN